jgi:putative chitinase
LISRAQLLSLAPHANETYLAAFELSGIVLPKYGITTPIRLAHATAQWLHETGGLTILSENLNYTHAARIVGVWPYRPSNPQPHQFRSTLEAEPYVRNPAKLANRVYGNRMGNVNPGDGAKFIGRGLLQLTGREAYRRYGRAVGVDLEANPDLACDARYILAIACAEWSAIGCNAYADADDLARVTRAINGGLVGIEERRGWLEKTKKVFV